MSAGVKAQEMSEDFCPKIHNSNAGSVQKMMDLSLTVSLLRFIYSEFDRFRTSS